MRQLRAVGWQNPAETLALLKCLAQAAHDQKDYERRNLACRLHDDLVLALWKSRGA